MWQHMFSMPVMRTVWRRELSSYGSSEEAPWYSHTPKRCEIAWN